MTLLVPPVKTHTLGIQTTQVLDAVGRITILPTRTVVLPSPAALRTEAAVWAQLVRLSLAATHRKEHGFCQIRLQNPNKTQQRQQSLFLLLYRDSGNVCKVSYLNTDVKIQLWCQERGEASKRSLRCVCLLHKLNSHFTHAGNEHSNMYFYLSFFFYVRAEATVAAS